MSSYRHQPTHRLEIVLGLELSRNDRPFAQLDALYRGILSSVDDVKATIRLLGILILVNLYKTPEVMGQFMFIDPGEIRCLLADLASVVKCLDKDTPIRMLHASFPDFLFDQSRSEEYYIDSSIVHAEIAQLYLSHIELHDSDQCKRCTFLAPSIAILSHHALTTCIGQLDDFQWPCELRHFAFSDTVKHLKLAEPSADLREALLNTCYITLIKLRPFSQISYSLTEFLSFLKYSVGYELHHSGHYFPLRCLEIHRYAGTLSSSS